MAFSPQVFGQIKVSEVANVSDVSVLLPNFVVKVSDVSVVSKVSDVSVVFAVFLSKVVWRWLLRME